MKEILFDNVYSRGNTGEYHCNKEVRIAADNGRREGIITLLYLAIDKEYKSAALRHIVKKYNLDYRTAKGLLLLYNDHGMIQEIPDEFLDPGFYTLDNVTDLARNTTGLSELIPAGYYSDADFLERTGIDKIPDGFIEGDDGTLVFSITKHIREIGDRAFHNCSHLVDITYDRDSTLERIGSFAFCDCKMFKTGKIPSTVYDIGAGCFMNCTSLDHMAIPRQVHTIKAHTFSGDTSLFFITAASGKLDVREGAFENCIQLTDIGGMISETGYRAFAGCTSLRNAEIESSIIGEEAYAGCSSLRSVHFRTTPAYFSRDCFMGCSLETVSLNGLSCQLHSAIGYCELDRHIRSKDDYLPFRDDTELFYPDDEYVKAEGY